MTAKPRQRPLRLVVLGMMGRCPFGGQTWLYLNWMRGLHRLGHEVWYVEDDNVWLYDPINNTISDETSYATQHIPNSLRGAGLPERWAFRQSDRKDRIWGMTQDDLFELYRTCDALLNIVGATELHDEQLSAKLRVYVETDPVTAELRFASGDEATKFMFANHHKLITYGENYGAADCRVPLDGLMPYTKTRQPIDTELWPMAYDANSPYFTTIGNYRQNGSDVTYNGETYRWSKHYEWEKFLDLPRRVKQPFELAVNVKGDDEKMLLSHGWKLASPLKMSLDIFNEYPAYFRGSRAEFTVAKDQNIRLRSGWFSERDVCYLACGKPVIAQETGFSNIIPTGEGLFAFETMEEAVAAVQAINADYPRHCKAARALVEEYFECTKLAKQLLKDIGLA